MKRILFSAALMLFSSFGLSHNTIKLEPGTSVKVDADVETKVECKGPKALSQFCVCEGNGLKLIIPGHSSQKYKIADYSSHYYCKQAMETMAQCQIN